MSQRDLVAELRDARIAAPPEVRERVRLIAAARHDRRGRRRFTWRRALVLAVPVAAAIAAAIVFTRPSHSPANRRARRACRRVAARRDGAARHRRRRSRRRDRCPALADARAALRRVARTARADPGRRLDGVKQALRITQVARRLRQLGAREPRAARRAAPTWS